LKKVIFDILHKPGFQGIKTEKEDESNPSEI